MEVSRCLVGQTPYISNTRVYSAGIIYDGALMMLNSTAWSSGVQNSADVAYFIIAALDTNAAAKDTLGAVQEGTQKAYADYMNSTNSGSPQALNIGSDYYADAAISVGGNYLPVCISPEVMYFAEYFQGLDNTGTGDGNVITASISASTSTTVTITDLQSETEGGFLFSTNKTSSTAYEPGQLRYITVGASGSCTIDSAMKVATTTDFILGLPPLSTRTGMTDDAVGMCSLTDKTANDATIGLCTGLMVFENWVNLGQTGGGLERFRYWSHKGLDGLKGFRAFAEVVLTDHLWLTIPA